MYNLIHYRRKFISYLKDGEINKYMTNDREKFMGGLRFPLSVSLRHTGNLIIIKLIEKYRTQDWVLGNA